MWYRTSEGGPARVDRLTVLPIVVLIVVVLCAANVRAQPVRLPPSHGVASSATIERLRGKKYTFTRLAPTDDASPEVVIELLPSPDPPAGSVFLETADSGDEDRLPPGAREGIFQRILFRGTWLPALGGNDLGTAELDLSAVFGFPFPTRQSPLLVTPDFAVHYLDGPTTIDLPPRVYDASVQFRWLRKLNQRWAMDLAVQPGVYTDFRSGASDALRILGRGLAIYDQSPTTRWVLGVAHLARSDVDILPVGGVIYAPGDDWRWDLVFPQPKIARRIASVAGPRPCERWAYIAGEFGGGVWAINPIGGPADTITLRDYRLLLGIETKVPSGLDRRVEVGYIFGRTIEFDSSQPDFELRDTLLLRVGASY